MTSVTASRRAIRTAAAVVALLVSSACGATATSSEVASAGGEANPVDTDGAGDTEQVVLDAQAQALVFAECMRDNGVDMPDPSPGRRGLIEAFQHEDVQDEGQETIERALAACQDLAPQYDHEPGHDQEGDETMLELAECLREQGLDVPDNLYGGGAGMHGVDEDDLRAAMEECRDLVPWGGGQ